MYVAEFFIIIIYILQHSGALTLLIWIGSQETLQSQSLGRHQHLHIKR